jgi:hypothetical protein
MVRTAAATIALSPLGMWASTYLLSGLQLDEHLHQDLDSISQEIIIDFQFMLAQQFHQDHRCIGHFVLLFCCFLSINREAQMTFFVNPLYTTL